MPSPADAAMLPRRLRRLALVLAALLALQACGFKGDLYLPDDSDPAKKSESRRPPPQL